MNSFLLPQYLPRHRDREIRHQKQAAKALYAGEYGRQSGRRGDLAVADGEERDGAEVDGFKKAGQHMGQLHRVVVCDAKRKNRHQCRDQYGERTCAVTADQPEQLDAIHTGRVRLVPHVRTVRIVLVQIPPNLPKVFFKYTILRRFLCVGKFAYDLLCLEVLIQRVVDGVLHAVFVPVDIDLSEHDGVEQRERVKCHGPSFISVKPQSFFDHAVLNDQCFNLAHAQVDMPGKEVAVEVERAK